jgi:hypothetical protein
MSDGMDIHARFVKKTDVSIEPRGFEWGWNGNIIPSKLWDDEARSFIEALRSKFPNGFKIVGDSKGATITPLEG